MNSTFCGWMHFKNFHYMFFGRRFCSHFHDFQNGREFEVLWSVSIYFLHIFPSFHYFKNWYYARLLVTIQGKRFIKFVEKYLVVSVEKKFEFLNLSEPHLLKWKISNCILFQFFNFQKWEWQSWRVWGRWCGQGCGREGGGVVGDISVKIKLTNFCLPVTLLHFSSSS